MVGTQPNNHGPSSLVCADGYLKTKVKKVGGRHRDLYVETHSCIPKGKRPYTRIGNTRLLTIRRVSGIKMVKSRDLADHSDTLHFGP